MGNWRQILSVVTRRPYTTKTKVPFLTKDQQNMLLMEFLVDEGDCSGIARAFKRLYGAELFAIDPTIYDAEMWGESHAFVWYKGKFYDSFGEVDPHKLLEYYSNNYPNVGYMIQKVDEDHFKEWNNDGADVLNIVSMLEGMKK